MAELAPKPDKYKAAGIGIMPPTSVQFDDQVAVDALKALDPSSVAITGGTIKGASISQVSVSQVVANSVGSHSPAWPLLYRLRATIISNGSTVSESDLLALRDPLDRLVRSSVWAKLVELWLPVGNGVLGALCKIKGTTLAMTGNNLVDADYTRWTGITGNGTNKDIATNFTPTGLTASWGFAVYPTGTAVPGSSKMLAGDGSTSYVGFGGGDSKINGSGSMTLFVANRMMAVQNQTGVGSSAWYGGYASASVTAGASACGAIRLLSYAGSLYTDTAVGGFAAWSTVLTAAEMKQLQAFFDDASYLLGRLGVMPSVVTVGDSNGAGFGVTGTQRWSYLLTQDVGAIEDNQALSGWAMSSTVGAGASGSWVTSHKVDTSRNAGSLLTCMFGTNDDRFGSTMTGYQADYDTWLNYQFTMGWRPSDVAIIAPVAATDVLSSSSRQVQMRTICQNLATTYGCIFVDGYGVTVGQPTYFQADNLHLSAALGHPALKAAVLSAYAQSYYAGALRL